VQSQRCTFRQKRSYCCLNDESNRIVLQSANSFIILRTGIRHKQAGKKLSQNIAKACKAHGCDANEVRELETNARYSGREISNVQFVAMMLRIGDLAHYNYDRAPVVLRVLHQFESNYSYEQWRIKANGGVEIWGENGKIYCQAFCDSPTVANAFYS